MKCSQSSASTRSKGGENLKASFLSVPWEKGYSPFRGLPLPSLLAIFWIRFIASCLPPSAKTLLYLTNISTRKDSNNELIETSKTNKERPTNPPSLPLLFSPLLTMDALETETERERKEEPYRCGYRRLRRPVNVCRYTRVYLGWGRLRSDNRGDRREP